MISMKEMNSGKQYLFLLPPGDMSLGAEIWHHFEYMATNSFYYLWIYWMQNIPSMKIALKMVEFIPL